MRSVESNLTEERGRILVVDDDELVLSALKLTLQREGYEVFLAQDGHKAVEMMKKTSPALIICDYLIPGIGGIEVLKEAQTLKPDTIRILLTASQDRDTAIKAINVGRVHQFITKPWKDEDLREIVRSSLEKYKLLKENQVLQELILSQHKKLKKSHENICRELRLGARIHEALLLGKIPKNISGFMIEALSIPSQEIDGDFFEFYRPSSRVLDVVLGDVMGKGIAAALVGNAVKTQMLRFAMPFPSSHIFDKKRGWYSSLLAPEEVLIHVHREVVRSLIDLDYFVSLFYGRFDIKYKTFSYVDCGSTKPIHYKAKEKSAVFLEGGNLPLGVVEEADYHTVETNYSEGDIFLFYSDGVTEARSSDGEFFGVERLTALVKANYDLQASALLDLIKKAVFIFTQKERLDDDLTLIVVKIGYYDHPNLAQFMSIQLSSDLSQLQVLRDFVNRFCQKAPGENERLANEMQLVLNETFCNIVKHGRSNDTKKPILVKGELKEEGVLFQLSDQGVSFDPSEVKEPSFCGDRDSGYGWHIIRELADSVSYTPKKSLQGWNEISIFKRYYFGEGRMNIKHATDDNILIITPEVGSLDAGGILEFKERVLELINSNNASDVVFDLNNLQFIDSSGLGSLLSVLRVLNSRGGDLKLSQMNKSIRTLFELVKMHQIFEIYHSTEDAVSSFR
ncbi:MAG: Phosphoserine phosphatase RsbU [Chlamydiae bacterium]|nr:Phosphoserine phosphatase RsbU [Chlamydiota bacterium]